MLNFTIKTPTEVVFGRDIEDGIGERIKEYGAHRVLVHFGGASARSSGLLDRVEHSLFDAGLSFVELGGVSPNPKISLVRKGVALCRREGLDFVLAVGGGSVIDIPGIKGFGTFNMEREEVAHFFRDIFKLSANCRFGNCTHTHEPGCAVLEALENHQLAPTRYASYLSILEDKEEGKYRAAY